MDERRRRHYLEAMGITAWVGRDAAEPEAPTPATSQHAASGSTESLPGQLAESTATESSGAAAVESAPRHATGPEAGVPAGEVADMDWVQLEQAVGNCRRCPLHESRRQGVFGVGNRAADWMFIGEAPGAQEDRLGEPFVGRAGQLLDAMLAATGHSREQVYIANIIKSRPPDNRDPQPEEIEACLPYLHRQIALIRPRVLMLVGRIAAQTLLDTTAPIGRLRGQVHKVPGLALPAVATYHPAYLLRSPNQKPKVWADLRLAMRTLAETGA